MEKLIFLAIVVLLVYICKESSGKVLPDYIHVCPGLTPECLKKTVQETLPAFVKGVPELGITPIDPLVQDYLNINLPGGLKVEMFNSRVTGIRKCLVDNVRFENSEADVSLSCSILIRGHYKAKGTILIMQINGDGEAKIKVTNATLKARLKFEDVERNGTIYRELKHVNVKHRFTDRIIFDLTNLFQGNPEISEAVLRFLNDNWKAIADEFAEPIVKILVNHIVTNIKKFFSEVPRDEIIVDNV